MENWQRQFIKKLFHYDAKRLDVEGAFRVKSPHIPASLYKYRTFHENHKRAFLANELWLVAAKMLNDPNECGSFFRPAELTVEDYSLSEIDFINDEIDKDSSKISKYHSATLLKPIAAGEWIHKKIAEVIGSESKNAKETIRAKAQEIMERYYRELVSRLSHSMREGVGVLSLSESSVSSLMWSHYADAHQGFVAEYDFGSLDNSDLRRRLCFPVFYSSRKRDVTRHMVKPPGSESFNNLFGQYLALIKHKEWSYEKEWRIVWMYGSSDVTKPILMPRPKSVIIGQRCSDEDKSWMLDICNERNIALKQASISDRNGTIEIVSILESKGRSTRPQK